MAKAKIVYVCQSCGTQHAKWMGKCPACNEWNTIVEEITQKSDAADKAVRASVSRGTRALRLMDVQADKVLRVNLHDNELNRVLGGGLVPGSVTLLGGEPGIGKSTLLLQICLGNPALKILYVSGEESLEQIRLRANRVGQLHENLLVTADTRLEHIVNTAVQEMPQLMIVDSVQTVSSMQVDAAPGTVTQIRDCTAELIKLAKQENIAIILVGHITKEGNIAGPKLLEHMVDTVLYFEGDRHYTYRILRTMKNRFGSMSELGLYEMIESGLRPVENPSEILLTLRTEPISGIAISSMIEGNRPFMIEIQSLVTTTNYGTPQRTTTGYDSRRMSMLLAVLEKRCGLKMGLMDVFVNVAGGLRVEDPAIDLAVAVAAAGSYHDRPIPTHACFAGEIGLSGEIRPVNQIDKRLSEAEKLGFTECYLSGFNKKSATYKPKTMKLIYSENLNEILYNLY